MTNEAMRFDDGKPQWALIPWHITHPRHLIGEVMEACHDADWSRAAQVILKRWPGDAPAAWAELRKVYELGAQKYARSNWQRGMAWSRILDAVARHLVKWHCRPGGELDPHAFGLATYIETDTGGAEVRHPSVESDKDDELGTHHLAHALWGLIALEYYDTYHLGADDL